MTFSTVSTNKMFAYFPIKIKNFFYYRLLWNTSFPAIIHIENTNACNADCVICAREKLTRPIGFMDFGLFKKIIDECSKHKEIVKEVHLHGYGEPLLDKLLFDKIRYAKEKGIRKTYFVTNASLLNSEIARKLISAGLDSIKFSFYGATKETYEKIHLGLKYEEVEDSIRNFFSIRKKMESKKPSVNIQFVPQKDNINEKEEFIRKWSGLIDAKNGDQITDFYLHNWIYGREYNCANRDRNPAELKSCAMPFMLIQILWNGDAVPCIFDFNGVMVMGQLPKYSIEEIWKGETYQQLRKVHRRRNYERSSLCMVCDQLR